MDSFICVVYIEMSYEWTSEIEDNLDLIRINSSQLSEHHHSTFLQKQQKLSTLKLPVILLSAANAYAVTGLRNMVNDNYLSISSTTVSSIISFLMVLEYLFSSFWKLETDLLKHKEFHSISQQIMYLLSMDKNLRKVDGKLFLDEKLSDYRKLAESSDIIQKFNSKPYVQAASELIKANKDVLLESGKTEVTQYLHDHWNILFHQKLFRIKKKNYSILQSLPADISPLSLEKIVLSVDTPIDVSGQPVPPSDPMKFYTNPFFNPFSYELYTKVTKFATLTHVPVLEEDVKEENKEDKIEDKKEETTELPI